MSLRLTTGTKRAAVALLLTAFVAGCEPADERAQSHLENGLKLAEEGDNARALLEFREATRLNGDLAPAYVAIAKIRESEGNMQSAVGHYTKAVEVDETNVPARVHLGRIMLAAGQLDEALRYAMAAAQLAPDDVEALTLRASVGVKVENFDLARDSAGQALAIDPNAANAHMVLAALDHRGGDVAAAETRIDGALESNPTHLALNLFKIRLLEQSGRNDEIPAVLQRLSDAYPDRPQFRAALIRWHLAAGDKDAAERVVRSHAAARPDDDQAALAVAQFVLQQRGAAEARAELEKQLASRGADANTFPFEMALVRMDLAERSTDAATARLEKMIAEYGDAANGDAARVRLAAIESGRDNDAKARELVEAVLSHDARNAQALAIRAQLKLNEDRFDAAIQDVRLALAEAPDNWRYLMLEAKAHEMNGSQSLVGERLAAAAQASGYLATPVLAYARHLKATGKNDFAEGLVENALGKRPNDPALLRALAQIKLDLKDWVGAEDVARQLRDLEGGDRLADFIDAQSLAGQANREESIKLLEGLYEKGETSRTSMAALVSSYLRSNQQERARAFLADVLKNQPDNLTALKLKGDLHMALNEPDEAEAAYRALIEKAPKQGPAYDALARFLVREKRYDEARAVAEDGVKNTGQSALKLTIALLLEQDGDYEGAVRVYKELYEDWPQSYVVANNLASLLIDRFPTPENIELAFRVAKRLRASEVPQYQDTYGWVLYLRGEPEQALRFLQPAAEKMPGVMLAQFHLGMAYAKAGVNDRALEALGRAIELAGENDAAQVAEAKATIVELKASAAKAN